MKTLLLLGSLALLGGGLATADVTITELEDRIRVEVDGQLFTEWRHKEWKAPYLYPVIGPNGENVTRHYPMKEGVPNEQDDHEWHRSIRFSHRNVNGVSFWSPDTDSKERGQIQLDKIEKITSGEVGEIVLWNNWIGEKDKRLILREKVRLSFHPLPERQMLMDYDIELHPVETPLTFFDEKDGGLAVRVAGTMKVEDRKTKEGNGTILNSRGNKNAEAWGKRAEWADYFGPDPSGKTVGIAIFDHPSNLRYPTHWHARTYGLMTANRFGKGAFEAKSGANKGDGDYTFEGDKPILLRHRFYFHHGDSEAGDVAKQYAAYSAGPVSS